MGKCIYSGAETDLKHRGEFTSPLFINAGDKLYQKYKIDNPDLTIEQCVDIIISAMVYRVTEGADKMDIKSLKGEKQSWLTKMKNVLTSPKH